MSNSKKGNVVVAEKTNVEVVENATYEKVLALIPAKEHRTFNEAEFAKVADLSFPADYAGVVEFVKPLGANELFALCTKSGRKEVERVAKLFRDNAPNLRPSTVLGLKMVCGGKTTTYAGRLTSAILSFKKNS